MIVDEKFFNSMSNRDKALCCHPGTPLREHYARLALDTGEISTFNYHFSRFNETPMGRFLWERAGLWRLFAWFYR